MNYRLFSLIYGFTIWLVATLIFRIWGYRFFQVENGLLITGIFLATLPMLYFLIHYVFKKYELDAEARLKSSSLMAVPGMFGDVLCIQFHHLVFPDFSLYQVITLSAWILWSYLIVITIGVLTKKDDSNEVLSTNFLTHEE